MHTPQRGIRLPETRTHTLDMAGATPYDARLPYGGDDDMETIKTNERGDVHARGWGWDVSGDSAGVAGVDSHDVVRQPFMDRVSVFWWAVALLACLSVAPPGIAFIMLAKGML